MQNILEIFHNIDMIPRVCEQYQFEECVADPTLHKLIHIVKELSSEEILAKPSYIFEKVWMCVFFCVCVCVCVSMSMFCTCI